MKFLLIFISLIISTPLIGESSRDQLVCGNYLIRGLFKLSKKQDAYLTIYPNTRREIAISLGKQRALKMLALNNLLVEIKIKVIHPGEIHLATLNFEKFEKLSTNSKVYQFPYKLIKESPCLIFANI